MKQLLLVLCSALFTIIVGKIVNKPENHNPYITPKWESLKKTEGKVLFLPFDGRKGSTGTHMRIKYKDGLVDLTCSLYGKPKYCYQFNDLGKPESYYEQLAFKKATVWWLPIKHKFYKGLVYQIEQNDKVVLTFETFDLHYQQEALKNNRK